MNISEMNVSLFRMINDLGKEFTFLNPIFIFIAQYTIYLLIAVVLFFLIKKERRMIFSAVISLIIAEIGARLVGLLHSNNQPFAELDNVNQLVEKAVDNSFPSDHTIIFFALCFTFFLFKKGFWWIILALFVGISRIWVGVHYPADVIVGAILAIGSSLLIYKIIQKTQNKVQVKNKSENF
ncbi:undecaprenyl-diphosphatase [Fredinandcohnia quinoae]|uniref:Undecaprenyl-diphosphatase n=1 Tax=Fredinandcohnia quinoae TaxID=2918902 RepID=A0AAW5E5A3_9BACI|nr:undecaprenyl-diphosphatase [Fredinandcohnia sp. SECRCQ15]MCH1625242.1 undecaprenyl-diphosphatase [Fredinandcohnia sp. SECRCQ15]